MANPWEKYAQPTSSTIPVEPTITAATTSPAPWEKYGGATATRVSGTGPLGPPPGPPKAPLPNELKPESEQEQSFITSPHGLIRTGLREAGAGIAAMTRPTTDEKFGAASQIARGLGKAALPAVIPIAAANPVSAIGAVVGGGIGGAAGGKIAEASGAGPGVQAASEDVGAFIGGGIGARGAGKLRTAVSDSFKIKPDIASEKIWRPAPADSDFPQVTPDAVSEVKTYGSPNVRTNAETKAAAEQTINTLQNHMRMWLDRGRQNGTRISGDSIVQATWKAIPETMKLEDPQGVQALMERARNAYGGRDFSTDQFREYLSEKNAGSTSFFGKSAAGQQAGITSGTPAAIEKAHGDAIREALYNALDPENGGAGPREIQARTGKVIDLRNASDRRSNAILGEKSVSQAGTVGKVAAGIGNIPGKLIHGDLEGAFNAFRNPGQGVSDPMVARLFQDVPNAPPIPKPGPMMQGRAAPQGPPPARGLLPGLSAAPNPRRALPPGSQSPIITPPPADTSFVRGVPAMTQPPNPRRALGPGGPSPIEAPPISPDASYVRSAPGMNQPPNPARALPPASTVQVPPSPLARPTGETIPSRTGEPGPDPSFARGTPALINPKTGQPWTAEELKSLLGGFNQQAKPNIIGGNIR